MPNHTMNIATDETEVLGRVIACGMSHEQIRGVVLSSSRVRPGARLDALSDYDVDIFVRDAAAFVVDGNWARCFGEPLLTVRDTERVFDLPKQNHMVLYTDGTKIDWSIYPVEALERIRERGALPDDYNEGFRVLLDKDGLFEHMPVPSGNPYLPAPPSREQYQALVEEWWWCATYVAKYLWRGAFMTMKVILDYEMKYLILGRLLGWRIGIDHQWSVNPGFFGRNLDRYVEPELWAEVQATYVGPATADNWDALARSNAVFRKVARSVARDLGFEYPEHIDGRVSAYLEHIRRLEPSGT